MSRHRQYILCLLGNALCLSPLGSLVWSTWFAQRHGCDLHEGWVQPCIVNGIDYGESLYSASVAGWFLLWTLPVALVLSAWLLTLVIGDVIQRFKRR